MSRKKDVVLWAAIVLGGGYLIYKLFNQQSATPGATPATGGTLPPPAGSIQQSLDTALTNLATGVTGIM